MLTIPKDWFAASIKKLPEVWKWCIVLSGDYVKCDYVAVIVSQPVFQANPDHFWMTVVLLKSLSSVGLGSILFAISIDNADLNQLSHAHCDVEPLVPSLMRSEPVIAASDPGKTMAEDKSGKPLKKFLMCLFTQKNIS